MLARLNTYWHDLPGNLRGGFWMLLAAAAFSSMNGLIKVMGRDLHGFEIAFFRALFGWLVVMPFALRHGIGSLRTSRPGAHLVRNIFGVMALLLSFYAIANLPLAAVTSILFSKPLYLIILALLFLGETVRWRRGLATLVGFGGVLLVVQPWQAGSFNPAALAAIAAAVAMSAAIIMIKRLTSSEKPAAMIFWFGVATTLGTLGPAIFVWQWPTPEQYVFLAMIGILGTVAQYFFVRAYEAGEATAVTPVDYFQLLFAGIIGFLAFGEVPGLNTVIGAAVIVVSTLYIIRREAKLAQAAKRK